jgi:hypothetical protein
MRYKNPALEQGFFMGDLQSPSVAARLAGGDDLKDAVVRMRPRPSALLQKQTPHPVAVRLAGVGTRKIAIAGEPDCYGSVVCF